MAAYFESGLEYACQRHRAFGQVVCTTKSVSSWRYRHRDVSFKRLFLYFKPVTELRLPFYRAPIDTHLTLIKRIVALPLDLVRPLDFTKRPTSSGQFLSDKVVEIPRGHCWLESDEPYHGHDSNDYFGPIPLGLIRARVAYIIWPRFKKLERGEWEEKSRKAPWEGKGKGGKKDEDMPRISYRSGGVFRDLGD